MLDREKDAGRTYQDQSVWDPSHYLGTTVQFIQLTYSLLAIYSFFLPFLYNVKFVCQKRSNTCYFEKKDQGYHLVAKLSILKRRTKDTIWWPNLQLFYLCHLVDKLQWRCLVAKMVSKGDVHLTHKCGPLVKTWIQGVMLRI